MIPYRLSLHNFLSYQTAVLAFQGLHTACICGPNGAGKSSLLEAITWVLWGESRAALEDDVIHQGAAEARVDFIFKNQQQIYRVLRSRHRQQTTVLEFQVAQAQGTQAPGTQAPGTQASSHTTPEDLQSLQFRSLTAKGVRATQDLITATLKLDYETFVNSAYLRQGRADEFMLKRPSDRKQVLADLLKLDQYDRLAEKAKTQARDYRIQANLLKQNLDRLAPQLQQQQAIQTEHQVLLASLAALQAEQERDRQRLDQYQTQQQQRLGWEQELQFQRQQRDRLLQDQERLTQEAQTLNGQQIDLAARMAEAAAIQQGYQQWLSLQTRDEGLAQAAEQYRALQEQQQTLQITLDQQQGDLIRQLAQVQQQLTALETDEASLQQLLDKAPSIEAAFATYQTARSHLQTLDQRQAEAAPLLQRHTLVAHELQSAQMRLQTRLETLQQQHQTFHEKQTWLPQVHAEYEATRRQVEYLEQRQQLQTQIRDKGLERRGFLERLQAHLIDDEALLAELNRKEVTLEDPQTPCPLCNHPLDEDHRRFAQEQYEGDRQTLNERIWVVTEQIATSKKEIAILRQEYRAIERDIKTYNGFLQRLGQLKQQLNASQELLHQLETLTQEIEQLSAQLQGQTYEPDLQTEYQQLSQALADLGYDERDHALAKGEVERWRWAKLKHVELRHIQTRWTQLQAQRPEWEAQRCSLEEQLAQLEQGELQQQLQQLQTQLTALDYSPTAHNQLRQALREAQPWQLRYQELLQAQQQLPLLQERIALVLQQQATTQTSLNGIAQQITQTTQALESSADLREAIAQLDSQIQQRRQRLDRAIAEQGRLQQQQQQFEALTVQFQDQQQQYETCQYQQQIQQELAQAFGKNGIQALMIENVLPQLEREANQILARLSANQLHVQFVTQKAQRRGQKSSSKSGEKLIDTLDIRIADAKGTRPYETYSGGEAFRVNFSIRLALARLLAQRSGTALQLLIVDEGFGTQDTEGCDRLIAAINAIAADFACILTITHMPQFKEAFQARIEITKTEKGSQLAIAV